MSHEQSHGAGQDAPEDEATPASDSPQSPFQLYEGDQAASANARRPAIPRPRPEGQASNFGTAELRPELFRQQSQGTDADPATSEKILAKVREAGKLAMEGRLDSATAVRIIEQIRALGPHHQAEQ